MRNDARSSFADSFHNFAAKASYIAGTKWAFILAVVIILAWAVTGPYYHYSDTWQLVINTGTTIVTFLIVFLIQNTQNRDARAIHLKLDEIIRAIGKAHNDMIDIENLSEEELQKLSHKFELIRRELQPKQQANSRKP
jgi:low affinity Fe/Cu permease